MLMVGGLAISLEFDSRIMLSKVSVSPVVSGSLPGFLFLDSFLETFT